MPPSSSTSWKLPVSSGARPTRPTGGPSWSRRLARARPWRAGPTRSSRRLPPPCASSTPRTSRPCGGSWRRSRGRSSLALALLLAQLDPPDLPGQRLRQVRHELDLARVRVRRVALAHVLLDRGRQLVRRGLPGGEHDERLHHVPAPLV